MKSRQFIRPDGRPFWKFLKNEKIVFDMDDFPFLTGHEIPRVKSVWDFKKVLSLRSRGEVLSTLYPKFGRALTYVGPVLDRERKYGFNDHTDRHTLWVSQTIVELLHRAGQSYDGTASFDAKTEILATLAAMTHDLGNFLGRQGHSEVSVWLLEKLFSRRSSREFSFLSKAVALHEEETIKEKGMDQGSPLLWALVAADKMHFGRDRIGARSISTGKSGKAMENDPHVLLNSLVVRSSWTIANLEFIWYLDFSVDILQSDFSNLSPKKKKRLWVPKHFQENYRKLGIKYRQSFKKDFLKTYGQRTEILAESVFLLFPFVKGFKVVLLDNDTKGKIGSLQMTLLTRKRIVTK